MLKERHAVPDGPSDVVGASTGAGGGIHSSRMTVPGTQLPHWKGGAGGGGCTGPGGRGGGGGGGEKSKISPRNSQIESSSLTRWGWVAADGGPEPAQLLAITCTVYRRLESRLLIVAEHAPVGVSVTSPLATPSSQGTVSSGPINGVPRS